MEILERQPSSMAPGEEHWDGGAFDSFMEYLALWEGTGVPEAVWGDKGMDAEYRGPRTGTRP